MLEATLILVNYRSEAHTLEVLQHLRNRPRECPARIVIVDNSPSRGLGHLDEIRREPLHYLPSRRNIGFAAAVNRGLDEAAHEAVILLNPDARPERGCLAGLVEVLHANPDHAVAGPRLTPFHPGDRTYPSALQRDPDLSTALIEYTAAHRLAGRGWLDRNYFLDGRSGGAPVPCAMVQGACFAMRRSWARRVGGFDAKRFFLYWEETDFCRRVREEGGRVLFCPELRCRHAGSASCPGGERVEHHFWNGFHAYHRRHGGVVVDAMLRLLIPCGIAAELGVLWGLTVLRRGRDAQLRADRRQLWSRLREQL